MIDGWLRKYLPAQLDWLRAADITTDHRTGSNVGVWLLSPSEDIQRSWKPEIESTSEKIGGRTISVWAVMPPRAMLLFSFCSYKQQTQWRSVETKESTSWMISSLAASFDLPLLHFFLFLFLVVSSGDQSGFTWMLNVTVFGNIPLWWQKHILLSGPGGEGYRLWAFHARALVERIRCLRINYFNLTLIVAHTHQSTTHLPLQPTFEKQSAPQTFSFLINFVFLFSSLSRTWQPKCINSVCMHTFVFYICKADS